MTELPATPQQILVWILAGGLPVLLTIGVAMFALKKLNKYSDTQDEQQRLINEKVSRMSFELESIDKDLEEIKPRLNATERETHELQVRAESVNARTIILLEAAMQKAQKDIDESHRLIRELRDGSR